MAKAQITLENGTVVTIEGEPDEVHRLLQLYSGKPSSAPSAAPAAKSRGKAKPDPAEERHDRIASVVNQIKAADESEAFEEKVLDQRNQMNRVLLPLYVVHEYMENRFGLSSGEIARITRELGVPVGQPDVSKLLGGSRLVLADGMRTPGKPTPYRISRRGVQFMKSVLAGTAIGE